MMKSVKFFLVALLLSAAVNANAQSAGDVIAKYNAAVEQVNAKNFGEAILGLNEAVKLGNEVGGDEVAAIVLQAQKLLPPSYLQAAVQYAQSGKMQEAMMYSEKAAELGEMYGDVRTMNNARTMISRVSTAMGADAFNNKDYPKAAEIFAKGWAANSTDTGMGLNLAMSYSEMGEFGKGAEVYSQIIAMGADNSKYAEAAATAKEKLSYYAMLRADEAVKAGDADGAITMLESVLQADPANAQAGMMLLQTANNAKKYDKVIELGEAVAAGQTDPALQSDAYFLLGAAYQNKENAAKAIENYRKVTAGSYAAQARTLIGELSK